MWEGTQAARGPSLEVGEYEFTLTVTTCSIKLKFPCKFSLSWKIDRESVEGLQKVDQTPNGLIFNQRLQCKTTVASSDSGHSHQPRRSTLHVNFFTPSKPTEAKLAGVVTLDLSKLLEGREEFQYSLERELDRGSWIKFSVECKFVRFLQPHEFGDAFSIMKLVQEGSEQYSVHNSSQDRISAGHPLTKSIERVVDRFFTPKSSREDSINLNPLDESQLSEVVAKENVPRARHASTDRHERSTEQLERMREGEQFETPKLRSDLVHSNIFIPNVNRPPPSTPAIPKEEVSNLMARFQSQKRLRESLQTELERARQENENLKSRTDEITDMLQQSEVKIKRLAESSRKDQQTQMSMLIRENQQMKDDNKQMRYTYEQEKSISESLQRELIQLQHLYEAEKQTSFNLQRQVDECRTRHPSTAVSPDSQSLKSSNISDRNKFVGELSRVQNAYKQKERLCSELERELEDVKRQLCEVQLQLQQERQEHSKPTEPRQPLVLSNERQLQLQERILELQDQMENLRQQQTYESEDEYVQGIIQQFGKKEQEIQAIFGVLEKECMRLISTIRSKQPKPTASQSVQVNLLDEPFSYAQSPIRAAPHQDYQASTDDLKQSMYEPDHVMDEEELARMRSQNESLRNSLVDSRRTLWDFKDMVFRNNDKTQHQKSQRSIQKAEKSIRYRHHLRHIDRLKMEYTDKLRTMYEQIMHLNEVIYLNSAKEKEMVLEVDQIQEKYKFMENASKQMRERLKECRQKHHDLIEGLKATNARQTAEIAKLKDTVVQQQEQLNSLKVQVDNMDNSDLLVVTNPGEIEQLQIELSKATNENRELERRCGEMMNYIEELRSQNQKSQQLLILKDSELEDAREQLRRKKLALSGSQNAIMVIDQQEPSYSGAIRQVLQALRSSLKSTEQMRQVKSALKIIFDIYEAASSTDPVNSRTEKLIIMQRIRQTSVEFQRIKIDRIKALQGNSELRKEFLRSIRPMQAKLDELLQFGQGVLNSKSCSYRRPITPLQAEQGRRKL